jgi:hypothetical protein
MHEARTLAAGGIAMNSDPAQAIARWFEEVNALAGNVTQVVDEVLQRFRRENPPGRKE